jgi:UDP-glucuronate 4-epimerase
VVGIDNLNSYYSVELKQARLQQLARWPNFRFQRLDIADRTPCSSCSPGSPSARSSTWRPRPGCAIRWTTRGLWPGEPGRFSQRARSLPPTPHRHLIYASSSSVYGANAKLPFSVEDRSNNRSRCTPPASAPMS